MKPVAIVYFSTSGHTQRLAHAIAQGVRSVPQSTATLWRIEAADMPEGRRKSEEIASGLLRADTIVLGTTTSIGGITRRPDSSDNRLPMRPTAVNKPYRPIYQSTDTFRGCLV
ncbi:MAG: hypothetical protein ACK6AT_04020 [Planctomycetota bacterium]